MKKNKLNLCHGVQGRMVRMLKFKSERFDLTSYVCVACGYFDNAKKEEKKVKTDFLCN